MKDTTLSFRKSTIPMDSLSAAYSKVFNEDASFQREYLEDRTAMYAAVLGILRGLGARSFVDVGCAFGLLVEMGNQAGLDAWGADFSIERLKAHHAALPGSKGKFVYGDIDNEPAAVAAIAGHRPDAAVALDVMRNLEHPENLDRLGARHLVIKEVSDNWYVRLKRKEMKRIPDVRLYSPDDCLDIFPGHGAHSIYPARLLFRISRPGKFWLWLVNQLSPTYTLVLEKRQG